MKFGDLKGRNTAGPESSNNKNQAIMVQQELKVNHMRQTVGPNFYQKREDLPQKPLNRSLSTRKNRNILLNTPKSLSKKKSKKSLNLRELENFMIGELEPEPKAKWY